jgi:hypothetical protein
LRTVSKKSTSTYSVRQSPLNALSDLKPQQTHDGDATNVQQQQSWLGSHGDCERARNVAFVSEVVHDGRKVVKGIDCISSSLASIDDAVSWVDP